MASQQIFVFQVRSDEQGPLDEGATFIIPAVQAELNKGFKVRNIVQSSAAGGAGRTTVTVVTVVLEKE